MKSDGQTARFDKPGPSTGLARALSKLGFCSRAQAWDLIKTGRVRVNGRVARDAMLRVDLQRDRIEADGRQIKVSAKVYLMLNKPRGLVTTASDERGRATVFDCFAAQRDLPRIFPVGRLDMASEGLLLFTNDTEWAARIARPESHLDKIYHVQVNCLADENLVRRLQAGVESGGEFLSAKRAAVLRLGGKNSWLEIVLDEGKNRHIRRLLEALDVEVRRLIRIAVGPLQLGGLARGAFRRLTEEEVRGLSR